VHDSPVMSVHTMLPLESPWDFQWHR